jgi:hypothetical protein
MLTAEEFPRGVRWIAFFWFLAKAAQEDIRLDFV